MRVSGRSSRSARAGDARDAATLVLGLALALICTLQPLRALSGGAYRGRLLVEVLRELQEEGLDLVFSTAVVPGKLRIAAEPGPARDPRGLLEELLAPLGLEATDGPGGSILILPRKPKPGRLVGQVRSASKDAPVPGATVQIAGMTRRATTGEDGRFTLGVPEGTYRVRVRALGYSPKVIAGVRVPAGASPPLQVALEDDPAFVSVVVTPGRHSLVRSPGPSGHAITGDEALLTPGVGGDLSRVVELLPGVTAADNSAAFNARGSVARDVSYVLDGLELYDPFHLQSFQSPFSLIDSNAVDRADFFGGGFTADRGDRHGGFLEVSTVGPAKEAGGQLEVGTLNSRLAYRSPARNGAWLLSLRGWYPEALVDSIEVGRGETDLEPRFGDFYAKAAFAVSPRLMLSAHGLFVYDRLKFQERNEEVNERVDVLTRNSYLWLRMMTSGSGGWSSETVLSGGRIDRVRDGVSAPDDAVLVGDEREVDFFGVEHDSSWQISGSHALKAGLDVRRLQAHYRYDNELPEDPDETVSLRLDPDGTSFAAYVAHRARVTGDVTTELGLRWDRQGHTDDGQLSPRFNLVWRLAERSELRFAVGRFSQSQRIHELQIEDGETGFQPAELADQAELTFRYGFGNGLRLRVDGYYRVLRELRPRYENLFEPIELFPETTEDRVMIAPSEARLRGIELMLRGDPARRLFWSVSYARSSAEDEIDGVDVPRSWDQPHAGKFLIGYQRRDRWSVSLAGTARTGWPTTPVAGEATLLPDGTTEFEVVAGSRNADRFPDYLRLDLQGRRSFPLPRGRLWLTLALLNVTDRENPCCVEDFFFRSLPDGRVDVDRQFDHWLGITPSFSLLWEF